MAGMLVCLLGFYGLRVECQGAHAQDALPAQIPSDGDAALAEVLKPILVKHRLPALAGAVVSSAGLRASAAVGFRKWGEPTVVTTNDLWHLGSDTKAMTAVLAARWVERRKLRWDTRVEEVFPDLAPQLNADARAVTIEQLLTHGAGLSPNLDWQKLTSDGSGDVRKQRLEALVRGLAEPPQHPPGARHLYSNLGYVICGAMLERLTDQAWEELVRAEVFEPLGMKAVGQGGMGTAGKLDQPWGHLAPGEPAPGYGPGADNPPVLGPAGRVHASLASWALFIADQLRGARGQRGLLAPESYRHLHRPAKGAEYALGWLVVSREWGGGTVLTHAGCNKLHYAVAWLAPRKDFAVLVCTNQGDDVAAKAADEAAWALIQSR